MTNQILLVFAHADEAAAFEREGVPHLVTGVGKINATFALTQAILERGVDQLTGVVVLGTAGGIAEEARLDTVYRVSAAVQHDYSLPSPELRLDPHIGAENSELENAVPSAIIATGDVFVQDDVQRSEIASTGAILVDMESYAYASVCERLGVPLRIFKTPSDFADSDTSMQTWDDAVLSNSDQLLLFAREHLPEIFMMGETDVDGHADAHAGADVRVAVNTAEGQR